MGHSRYRPACLIIRLRMSSGAVRRNDVVSAMAKGRRTAREKAVTMKISKTQVPHAHPSNVVRCVLKIVSGVRRVPCTLLCMLKVVEGGVCLSGGAGVKCTVRCSVRRLWKKVG